MWLSLPLGQRTPSLIAGSADSRRRRPGPLHPVLRVLAVGVALHLVSTERVPDQAARGRLLVALAVVIVVGSRRRAVRRARGRPGRRSRPLLSRSPTTDQQRRHE